MNLAGENARLRLLAALGLMLLAGSARSHVPAEVMSVLMNGAPVGVLYVMLEVASMRERSSSVEKRLARVESVFHPFTPPETSSPAE